MAEIKHILMFCQSCGKATTMLEAHLRKFNVGRCAVCNGELRIDVPKNRTMTRDDF